jgi:predicted RNA-binding protein YlxR (DUF448 family)
VGCRQRADRSRLLRVVAGRVDGVLTLLPDARARLPGRGAWLHPDTACLDLAERRRAFPRALRLQGPVELSGVRAHLQQLGSTPSTTESSPPSTSTGSGSASDGHPMSSQR